MRQEHALTREMGGLLSNRTFVHKCCYVIRYGPRMNKACAACGDTGNNSCRLILYRMWTRRCECVHDTVIYTFSQCNVCLCAVYLSRHC